MRGFIQLGTEDFIIAKRRDVAWAVRSMNALQRLDIQMIVVIMRDNHEIDSRQIFQPDTGSLTRFGPAKETGLVRSDQTGSVRI